MAGDELNITTVSMGYTYQEAVQYIKAKTKRPTTLGESIRWYSRKTGKQVIIGACK